MMRSALWLSALLNLGAAALFAFPDSTVGQLAGLPRPVPGLYRAIVACFILLFGGAYAFLARQPVIDRPMVAMSAIGKTSVFLIILVFWLAGAAPGRGVLFAMSDLALAALFTRWLQTSR